MKKCLFAPPIYWKLTPEQRAFLTNGCGTRRIGFLIPDTAWGVSIKEACNIHDFMYRDGKTIEDKESADRTFLNNMLRIIDGESRCELIKVLRRYRAMSYYSAVRDFGGPAFWSGKNKPEEMGRLVGKDLRTVKSL